MHFLPSLLYCNCGFAFVSALVFDFPSTNNAGPKKDIYSNMREHQKENNSNEQRIVQNVCMMYESGRMVARKVSASRPLSFFFIHVSLHSFSYHFFLLISVCAHHTKATKVYQCNGSYSNDFLCLKFWLLAEATYPTMPMRIENSSGEYCWDTEDPFFLICVCVCARQRWRQLLLSSIVNLMDGLFFFCLNHRALRFTQPRFRLLCTPADPTTRGSTIAYTMNHEKWT